eukprot:gene25837-46982_t
MSFSRLTRIPLALFFVALLLPVVAVFGAWLPWGESGAQSLLIVQEMARTVLPEY